MTNKTKHYGHWAPAKTKTTWEGSPYWELAVLIKSAGVTDVEIARQFKVSLAVVAKWRRGEDKPKPAQTMPVLEWLRERAKPAEDSSIKEWAKDKDWAAEEKHWREQRVRTEDFIHLYEVAMEGERNAIEMNQQRVELSAALGEPMAPIDLTETRKLVEDLRASVARQLGGPPCTQCHGRGSWPPPTRQRCTRCKGKRVEP